jgi:hypothetical protein
LTGSSIDDGQPVGMGSSSFLIPDATTSVRLRAPAPLR